MARTKKTLSKFLVWKWGLYVHHLSKYVFECTYHLMKHRMELSRIHTTHDTARHKEKSSHFKLIVFVVCLHVLLYAVISLVVIIIILLVFFCVERSFARKNFLCVCGGNVSRQMWDKEIIRSSSVTKNE